MHPVALATKIGAVVRRPDLGGGAHRDHVAELVGLHPSDPTFGRAVGIAIRRGLVDAYRGWLIAVPAPAARQEVTAA